MHSISIVNIEDTAPILKKPDEPLAKHARVGDADKNKPGKFIGTSVSVDMEINWWDISTETTLYGGKK